jgi:serine/threonine-protein kinase
LSLTPGTRIGVFQLIDLIGRGGMGEVYRATDTKLKRQVAIKILPPSLVADHDRLARFQREAEVLASLNHPNIAAIYGLEESEGVTALVMELVEGDDLSQRIARGAIPIDEVLPIATQIAEALEAAHEQGIIHRDLKPANIKVRADGTVKVLDFGLAKALEPAGAMSASVSMAPTITTPAMTQAGMILGTAAYMAPEQAKGRTVDRRADIWAFGVVLYEMLTAHRAFGGEDVSDTLANVLKTDPAWERLPAGVPARIRQVLRSCLQRDAKQRLGDMQSVRLALEGAFETAVVPQPVERASAVPPLWRRALPVAATIVLTAAIVAGAAWSLRPPPAPSAPLAQFQIQPPEGLALDVDNRQSIAMSPDGTRLIFRAGGRLFVRAIGEVEATPIPGIPEGMLASAPAFSPDGASVVFWANSDGTLNRVPVAGGQALTIAQGISEAPLGMTWGDDGIAFAARLLGGVFRVSPNGGVPERLAQVGSEESALAPQILPGGEFVMFTLGTKQFDTEIVVQSLASGERRTIVGNASDARYLPTGHLVYVVAGTMYGVAFDLAALTVRGEAVPVVTGVRRAGAVGGGGAQFSVSSNGSLLYLTGPLTPAGQDTMRVPTLVDRAGTRVPLALPPKVYTRPRVSTDGSRLAMGVDEGDDADVWVYELSGTSAIRRLTFGGRNRFPVWSPDGRRVAFQSDRDGRLAIYAQPADGGGAAERLTDPAEGVSHVPDAWSPDGRTLLFSEEKGGTYAVMALSVADKRATPVAGVEGRDPPEAVFSPDGRWVAYSVNKAAGGVPSPDRGIFVQPFPATGATYQVPKTLLDFHAAWGPSGRELFYVPTITATEPVAVSVQIAGSPTFGTPTPLKGVPEPGISSGNHRGYDVLPDGRFITLLPADSGPAGVRPELRVIINWTDELKRLVPTK